MAKCFVQISEVIALVHINEKCWVIDTKKLDQPQECPAPQMYNIRMYKFFEEIVMDDEYPFSQASQLLQKKACQNSMLNCALSCMDKKLAMELRKNFAGRTKEFISEGYGQLAFEWLSDLLLNTPLPKDADINQKILDCMAQKFQELFQQVFQKYRKIDIFNT